MKKTYLLSLIAFMSFLFIQCSSDDSSRVQNGTLLVNGNTFALGTNAPGDVRNSILSGGVSGFYTTAFSITKNTTDPTDLDVITITIVNDQPNRVDGTYSFANENDQDALENYAVGGYFSAANNSDYGTGQVTGTVKITKISGNTYKLEFNNVSMGRSGTSDAKTITGYCELEFQSLL